MNATGRTILVVAAVVVVVGAAALALRSGGSGKDAGTKAPPPATATKAVKESDLNIVTLTPEAEKRLGVVVAPVEQRAVNRSRFFGGQVTVPPGRAVVVSAPFAGTVAAPSGAKAPVAGGTVKQGQAVFALLPLLTSEARATLATALVDAEGQANSAEVQLAAAQVALERSKQVVSEGAGSRRTLDDAQAQYELARKALEAARSRRESLGKVMQGGESGSVAALDVIAPDTGVLRNVHAAPGQMVASGAQLFEILNQSVVWVRVPVYSGDVTTIAGDKPARVGLMGTSASAGGYYKAVTARPVEAPPSADPLGSTVDLFYELDNKDGALSPGQKVGVTLNLRDEQQSLVVPWSAVVFDVYGGAWVYENTGPHAYVRRRVQVRHVVDNQAVLATGPAAGANVLVQGAAEVFGFEMGFAK